MLDPDQQAAVAHGDGPAIVLAGPGSGKTRVIVERAVRLIDEERARPEQLLILTFSRKAATDLRERIAARLQRSYASFPVTTFHAFALALLTREGAEQPTLARPAARWRAMQAALAAEGDLGLHRTNALVEEALRFSELCDDYLELPDHRLTKVRERYLTELAGLDYGGLQREAIALLEQRDDTRRSYQEAFRYVLVDEYQDTNVAQDRLLELLSGEHRNIFCVADEDQSIYGFRGAEIDNTLGFADRWPGATRYDLPTNYRSAPKIVGLATSVIQRNIDTHLGKPLRAAEEREAQLVGRTFRHAAEEADWIAREIAGLRLDGVALGADRRPLPLAEAGRSAACLRAPPPRASRFTRRSHHSSIRPPAPSSRCSSSPPPIHGKRFTTTKPCACSPLRSSAPTPSSYAATAARAAHCLASCATPAASTRSSRRSRS